VRPSPTPEEGVVSLVRVDAQAGCALGRIRVVFTATPGSEGHSELQMLAVIGIQDLTSQPTHH